MLSRVKTEWPGVLPYSSPICSRCTIFLYTAVNLYFHKQRNHVEPTTQVVLESVDSAAIVTDTDQTQTVTEFLGKYTYAKFKMTSWCIKLRVKEDITK